MPSPPALHLQIDLVYGRIHNALTLPALLRAFNGVALGYMPHMTEPLWGVAAEVLFNDEFYKRRRLRTQEKAKHGGGLRLLGLAVWHVPVTGPVPVLCLCCACRLSACSCALGCHRPLCQSA